MAGGTAVNTGCPEPCGEGQVVACRGRRIYQMENGRLAEVKMGVGWGCEGQGNATCQSVL